MPVVSMQCRSLPAVNRTMAPRASVQRNRLLCRAAVECAEGGATRRQSLGLLLALPVFFTGNVANAVELGDARKVKGATNFGTDITSIAVHGYCKSLKCAAYPATASPRFYSH